MDPWYDLHSWSKLYRQEAQREARERDLVEQARTSDSPRSGRSSVNWIRKQALPLLRKAYLAQ
jgi:hypothetical protein